jgi:TonB family protein
MPTAITFGVLIALAFSLPARADDREVVSKVKVVCPEMAKRLKITGTVLLNATVAPNGTVMAVKTVMGEKMLVEAAKDAVMKWRYAPAEHETIEDVEVEFH